MSFDPVAFGIAMGDIVREAVEPLQARIAVLEKQLEALPTAVHGKDGADGRDGKDCDIDVVKAMIDEAIKALPAPEAGKDGANGKDGASVTLDDVRPLLSDVAREVHDEAMQKLDEVIKAIPAPRDGREGSAGKDGKDGEKGADGAGIADLLTDRDGALVATFTDGRMKNLGVIVGKDGRDGVDGKDGADGLGLDSFDLEYLGDTHEICVKAKCAGRVKELRYPAGGIHGKGYWREGIKASANEAWTHDGCMWIATKATAAKPEASSPDWFLAARKGRDGERGAKGQDASPPTPIKLKD